MREVLFQGTAPPPPKYRQWNRLVDTMRHIPEPSYSGRASTAPKGLRLRKRCKHSTRLKARHSIPRIVDARTCMCTLVPASTVRFCTPNTPLASIKCSTSASSYRVGVLSHFQNNSCPEHNMPSASPNNRHRSPRYVTLNAYTSFLTLRRPTDRHDDKSSHK